ncbi:hypothetical protein EVAR_91083_1 [Eumeta japonica]|uniref:Uncharacterized protein n=1 Tax=Eumeta variegata TaxID=151549 RepID=A0A4C1SS18_EUMVA|nr:hypothetical protein EVAR_91083_1 [Eumeta japonica]
MLRGIHHWRYRSPPCAASITTSCTITADAQAQPTPCLWEVLTFTTGRRGFTTSGRPLRSPTPSAPATPDRGQNKILIRGSVNFNYKFNFQRSSYGVHNSSDLRDEGLS